MNKKPKIKPSRKSMTIAEIEEHIEMVTTVAMLPAALYQKYRRSGKTVEEVYKEITSKN